LQGVIHVQVLRTLKKRPELLQNFESFASFQMQIIFFYQNVWRLKKSRIFAVEFIKKKVMVATQNLSILCVDVIIILRFKA